MALIYDPLFLNRDVKRLDTTRLDSVTDTKAIGTKTIAVIGCGGGATPVRNVVRFGIRGVKLFDHDNVELVNICRQEHMYDQLGKPKVHALGDEVLRINPNLYVEMHQRDFCLFTDEEIDQIFQDVDLLLVCVDNLPANAGANEVALRLKIPLVISGLYREGAGGEVFYWYPGLPCYRDLCGARYAAHERGEATRSPSDGADIFAMQHLDSITGMIVLGLLTRGADNFYGRLVDSLGDKNYIQIKIKDWSWNGRDIVREQLQIPGDNDRYVGWCAIARRDPNPGVPPCPDCLKFGNRLARQVVPNIPDGWDEMGRQPPSVV